MLVVSTNSALAQLSNDYRFSYPVGTGIFPEGTIVSGYDVDFVGGQGFGRAASSSHTDPVGTRNPVDSGNHLGYDFNGYIPGNGDCDDAVKSVAYGIIDRVRDDVTCEGCSGWGNFVRIKHTIDGHDYFSSYTHLKPNSVIVGEGEHVYRGQQIGSIGNTGHSFGCHLHFQIRTTNSGVDRDNILEDKGNGCGYLNSRCVASEYLDPDVVIPRDNPFGQRLFNAVKRESCLSWGSSPVNGRVCVEQTSRPGVDVVTPQIARTTLTDAQIYNPNPPYELFPGDNVHSFVEFEIPQMHRYSIDRGRCRVHAYREDGANDCGTGRVPNDSDGNGAMDRCLMVSPWETIWRNVDTNGRFQCEWVWNNITSHAGINQSGQAFTEWTFEVEVEVHLANGNIVIWDYNNQLNGHIDTNVSYRIRRNPNATQHPVGAFTMGRDAETTVCSGLLTPPSNTTTPASCSQLAMRSTVVNDESGNPYATDIYPAYSEGSTPTFRVESELLHVKSTGNGMHYVWVARQGPETVTSDNGLRDIAIAGYQSAIANPSAQTVYVWAETNSLTVDSRNIREVFTARLCPQVKVSATAAAITPAQCWAVTNPARYKEFKAYVYRGNVIMTPMSCTADSHCPGTYCDVVASLCASGATPGGNGAICSTHSECNSTYCNNAQTRVCASTLSVGSACSVNEECSSDHCTAGVCEGISTGGGVGGNVCPPVGANPGEAGWCTQSCPCDVDRGLCQTSLDCVQSLTSQLSCDTGASSVAGYGYCRSPSDVGTPFTPSCTPSSPCNAEQGPCTNDFGCTSGLSCDLTAGTLPNEGVCRVPSGAAPPTNGNAPSNLEFRRQEFCVTQPNYSSSNGYDCMSTTVAAVGSPGWASFRIRGPASTAVLDVTVDEYNGSTYVATYSVAQTDIHFQGEHHLSVRIGDVQADPSNRYEVYIDVGNGRQWLGQYIWQGIGSGGTGSQAGAITVTMTPSNSQQMTLSNPATCSSQSSCAQSWSVAPLMYVGGVDQFILDMDPAGLPVNISSATLRLFAQEAGTDGPVTYQTGGVYLPWTAQMGGIAGVSNWIQGWVSYVRPYRGVLQWHEISLSGRQYGELLGNGMLFARAQNGWRNSTRFIPPDVSLGGYDVSLRPQLVVVPAPGTEFFGPQCELHHFVVTNTGPCTVDSSSSRGGSQSVQYANPPVSLCTQPANVALPASRECETSVSSLQTPCTSQGDDWVCELEDAQVVNSPRHPSHPTVAMGRPGGYDAMMFSGGDPGSYARMSMPDGDGRSYEVRVRYETYYDNDQNFSPSFTVTINGQNVVVPQAPASVGTSGAVQTLTAGPITLPSGVADPELRITMGGAPTTYASRWIVVDNVELRCLNCNVPSIDAGVPLDSGTLVDTGPSSMTVELTDSNSADMDVTLSNNGWSDFSIFSPGGAGFTRYAVLKMTDQTGMPTQVERAELDLYVLNVPGNMTTMRWGEVTSNVTWTEPPFGQAYNNANVPTGATPNTLPVPSGKDQYMAPIDVTSAYNSGALFAGGILIMPDQTSGQAVNFASSEAPNPQFGGLKPRLRLTYHQSNTTQTGQPDGGVMDAGSLDAGAGSSPDPRCNNAEFCYTFERHVGNLVEDEGSAGYDLTVVGATPTMDRHGQADSAYHVNGGTYLEATGVDLLNLGDFTLSYWYRQTAAPGYFVYPFAIHSGVTGHSNAGDQVIGMQDNSHYATAQRVNYQFTTGNGEANALSAARIAAASLNDWHQDVLVREGNAFRVYRDGVLLSDVTANKPAFSFTGGRITIGGPNYAGNGNGWSANGRDTAKWIGDLDDFVLRRGATSATEIANAYTAALQPPTTQSTQVDGGVMDVGTPDSGVHAVTFQVEDWLPNPFGVVGYPQAESRTDYTVMRFPGGDMHSAAYIDTSELVAGRTYEVCASYYNQADSPELSLEFGWNGVDYGVFPAGTTLSHLTDPSVYCLTSNVTIPSYSGTITMQLRVGMTYGQTHSQSRWIGVDWIRFTDVTP